MHKISQRLLILFSVLLISSWQVSAAPKLVMTEYMVPSDTPGISLYVRNKHPEGMKQFSPDKTLLYVHGSTYPSETAFDLSLGGICLLYTSDAADE